MVTHRLLRRLCALAFVLSAGPARADGDPEFPQTLYYGRAKAQGLALGASAPSDLPRALRLDYTLGPGTRRCAKPKTMEDTVVAAMSFDPFVKDAPARLVVNIRRQGAQHMGHAEIVEAKGKVLWAFDISHDLCYLVTDALGLAIGITLDPPHPPSPPAASPPPPRPPSPPPPRPPSPVLPPAPRPAKVKPSWFSAFFLGGKRTLDVELGGALALGKVPAVAAFELVAAGRVRQGTLSLGTEMSWIPPVSLTVAEGGQVHGSRFSMGLVPCGHVRWFFGCGLVQFSALFGSMAHMELSRWDNRYSAGLGGRLGADVPLRGRLSLRFSGDLVALVPREVFHVDFNPQWISPPVAGVLGAGLVSTF